MIIKIHKNINLTRVENLYKQLEIGISIKAKIDILFPIELTVNYLGITPALIQFISTWIRYNKSGKLMLDLVKPDSEKIINLYKNEFIFPIAGLVWNHNGIFDREGNNLRNLLSESQNKVFAKMKRVEAYRGEKLLLTNLDHLPKENGILPCFEKNGLFVSNESDLMESLKDTLENEVFRNYFESRLEFKKIEIELIGIIHELMKNTFEWARDDQNGVPFETNIRGLLVKHNKKTRSALIKENKDIKAIIEYFNSSLFKENNLQQIRFLEISVFDSGAGFVNKFRSSNKNYENSNDVDIIKRCLIKHNTIAKSLDKDEKGLGLDRILKILNGKGFLRIRTGTKSLYRNLINDQYKNVESNSTEQMILFDWILNDNNKYSDISNVSGSVITIIYPLSINQSL
ncbi:hypothetical protein [Flavobacterium sp. LC2016-12]|uniref:hypothetical protein n=1 Tax=Flavobacterium sp. LC2016-12 TaxID=2783794 RepID=UPI00188B19DC|nr:hypothetical protein [Flavobacterium sp. LC2016-12]MBF4466258.1 hypothetical protein [Flavobacterium sp. LC2016-12]